MGADPDLWRQITRRYRFGEYYQISKSAIGQELTFELRCPDRAPAPANLRPCFHQDGAAVTLLFTISISIYAIRTARVHRESGFPYYAWSRILYSFKRS